MAKTTLVILTYNRREEAMRTVSRALALPERPPVIVVDNASRDGTVECLRARFPAIRILPAPRNLGACARNLGAEAASTPYVAFSDDDTSWCPGSIALGESLLDRHPRVAALNARVAVGNGRQLDPTCREMAASPLPREGLPGPALMGFLAGATMFRRRAFAAAGGYEPRFFLGGEEALLAFDLVACGWHIVYVDAMTVLHEPSLLRDAPARSSIAARNELWLAWMRRRAAAALAITGRAVLDAQGRHALLRALPGLAWALRRRRALPHEWESWRCRLDAAQGSMAKAIASRIGPSGPDGHAQEADSSPRNEGPRAARRWRGRS